MNARKNKRRLYKVWRREQLYSRLSAEDRAWLNMAPVGREFGSPDYDRLMQEDARAGIDWSFPSEERVAEIHLKRKEKQKT